jgi:hypothetical protein
VFVQLLLLVRNRFVVSENVCDNIEKDMVKLMSLEMFRKKVINTKKKHEVTSPYIFSTERNTF